MTICVPAGTPACREVHRATSLLTTESNFSDFGEARDEDIGRDPPPIWPSPAYARMDRSDFGASRRVRTPRVSIAAAGWWLLAKLRLLRRPGLHLSVCPWSVAESPRSPSRFAPRRHTVDANAIILIGADRVRGSRPRRLAIACAPPASGARCSGGCARRHV